MKYLFNKAVSSDKCWIYRSLNIEDCQNLTLKKNNIWNCMEVKEIERKEQDSPSRNLFSKYCAYNFE